MNSENRFDKRLKVIPAEIWSKVTQIEELKGQWTGGVKLNPQVLGRLKKSVLVTSTGASTRIEGAHLTDEDVEKLMRGLTMQKFANRDKQEVKGYYELLQNVFDSWQHLKFNESLIKHFHKVLLKSVEKDKLHREDYKKTENKVEMKELVEWTRNALENKRVHPLVVVANYIVEFLNIHPFQDGNGRSSRILTNLLMLHSGYLYMPYVSHEKLVEDHKSEYYIALRKSQRTIKTDREDITAWLDFFLGVVHQQSKMAVALLSQENIEKTLSPKQLAVWQYLQTVEETSPGEISKKAKVARPTVNQALDKLLRLKKIERIGLGRTTRYIKIK